jgi:hypothetical protein
MAAGEIVNSLRNGCIASETFIAKDRMKSTVVLGDVKRSDPRVPNQQLSHTSPLQSRYVDNLLTPIDRYILQVHQCSFIRRNLGPNSEPPRQHREV